MQSEYGSNSDPTPEEDEIEEIPEDDVTLSQGLYKTSDGYLATYVAIPASASSSSKSHTSCCCYY